MATEASSFAPLHYDVLQDAQYGATFYPGGYVVTVGDDDFRDFIGERGQVFHDPTAFFDGSIPGRNDRDALLHEVCHYLQFTSTSLGYLHSLLTVAAAELVIQEAGLFIVGSRMNKGAKRLPSETLPFLTHSSTSQGAPFCTSFSRAVGHLWNGALDSREIGEQLENLKRGAALTFSQASPEGQVVLNSLASLDASKEPASYAGGSFVFPIDVERVPLFGVDRDDLQTHVQNGVHYLPTWNGDLFESHARLMEEYIALLTVANGNTTHPWATDVEYRSSRLLAGYGHTRHAVNNALVDHPPVKDILRRFEDVGFVLQDRDTLDKYVHVLEMQLLVHDVALMVPLVTTPGDQMSWSCFSPLERLWTGIEALRSWPTLPVGCLRDEKQWIQLADLICARIGGASYSETLVTLNGLMARSPMPHLRAMAEYRKSDQPNPYSSIFAITQGAVGEGPGPLFLSKTGTAHNRWLDSPESMLQWKVWIWAVTSSFFEANSKERAQTLARLCEVASTHARAATRETGLVIAYPNGT